MKRKKMLLAALISYLLVIVLPTTSYADMGPKDELTVYQSQQEDPNFKTPQWLSGG